MEVSYKPSATNAGPGAYLGDVIARLMRLLRANIRASYPHVSYPMVQLSVLQVLADHPGISLGELAKREHLAMKAASALTQRMVAAGRVSRSKDPNDGRLVILDITDEGRNSLQQWQDANARTLESLLQELSTENRALIREALPALQELAVALEVHSTG